MPAIPPNKLIKGEHYYINEQGLFVFTKKYHLARGYCCKSGCKHCPYEFGKSKNENENLIK